MNQKGFGSHLITMPNLSMPNKLYYNILIIRYLNPKQYANMTLDTLVIELTINVKDLFCKICIKDAIG